MAQQHENIIIHVKVRHGAAVKQLGEVAAAIKAVKAACEDLHECFDDLDFDKLDKASGKSRDFGDETDKTRKKIDYFQKSLWKQVQTNSAVVAAKGKLKAALGGILKMAKWLVIEFAVMTAALGAVKFAVWAAEGAVKLWNVSLNAMGAAAGVAIGGLAGVLSAMRELQAVRLSPLFENNKSYFGSSEAGMNMLLADNRFGMFSDGTLISAMEQARQAGQQTDQSFRNLLATLGNFAVSGTGDPNKNLGELAQAFIRMQQEGKITSDIFESFEKSAPALAQAVAEIASGGKKLDPKKMLDLGRAAAEGGKVTSEAFIKAIQDGSLETTKAYEGLLDKVNNTIVGRFKKQLRVVKETLIEIGEPIREVLNPANGNPIDAFGQRLRVALYQIAPTVQKSFGEIFDKLFAGNGMDSAIDRLVRRILVGMPKIIGWAEGLSNLLQTIGRFFRGMIPWLDQAGERWDRLYAGFVKPIGLEIFKTIKFAIDDFGDTMSRMDSKGFRQTFEQIGEGIRNMIMAFNDLREKLAPITEGFFRFIGMLAGNKIIAYATVWGLILSVFAKVAIAVGNLGNKWVRAMYAITDSTKGAADQTDRLDGATGRLTFRQRIARAMGFSGSGKTPTPADRAAKLAGVGMAAATLGSFAGYYIQGKAPASDVNGQMLGGALSGAGTGAMLGTMVAGPVGTAVGAALGGVVGSLTGIAGALKAREQERQKRIDEDASNLIKGVDRNDPFQIVAAGEAISTAVDDWWAANHRTAGQWLDLKQWMQKNSYFPGSKGNVPSRVNPLTGVKQYYQPGPGGTTRTFRGEPMTQDEFDEIGASIQKAAEEIAPGAMRATRGLDTLREALGMSQEQIIDFANSSKWKFDEWGMGINAVFEKVLGYTGNIITDLGIAAERVYNMLTPPSLDADEEKAKAAVRLEETLAKAKGFAGGTQAQTDVMAYELTNMIAEATAKAFAAGDIAPENLLEVTQRGRAQTLQILKDNNADPALISSVERILKERQFTVLDTLNTPGAMAQLDPAMMGQVKDLINSYLADPTANNNVRAAALESDPTKRGQIEAQNAQDFILQATSGLLGPINARTEQYFASVGMGGVARLLTDTLDDPTTTENFAANITEAFKTGAVDFLQTLKTWNPQVEFPTEVTAMRVKVDGKSGNNFTLKLVEITPPKDTSSPRSVGSGFASSRWAATLGQHLMLNGGLPGRRSITSGVRSSNLGSLGSDHLHGRAYDLVGDNLIGYATRVRAAGGFAEFHGGLSDRHLHVVPQVGPVGDSSVPANLGSGRASTGTMTQNVSFNITAGSSASPEEIAQAVMVRLARAERNARERM